MQRFHCLQEGYRLVFGDDPRSSLTGIRVEGMGGSETCSMNLLAHIRCLFLVFSKTVHAGFACAIGMDSNEIWSLLNNTFNNVINVLKMTTSYENS